MEEGTVLKACVRHEAQPLTFPCVLWKFFFWFLFVLVYLFEKSSQIVQVGFKHVAEARLEFPFLLFLLAEG